MEKPKGVAALIAETFGAGSIMSSVARCESGYRQYNADGTVLRGKVNPDDVGVFQINEHYHLADSQKMGVDIHTTEGNIKYAKHLYDTQGTRPWNWSKGCWGT